MNKLLLALAITIHTASLHCMELQKKPSPFTFAQTYYYLSHDLELVPDIAQQIFLLHLKLCNNVDLKKFLLNISQECNTFLVACTDELVKSCGYPLASELCEYLFAHAKISLCPIQDDQRKKTSLFYAITCGFPEVAQLLAKIAGDDALKLLTMRVDAKDNTTLHHTVFAQDKEAVKLVLDLADDKAYTLLTIKGTHGGTAFDCAPQKIKEMMQKYMPTNKG